MMITRPAHEILVLFTLSKKGQAGLSWADLEGGGEQGVGTPLKNHKNIGFLSNTGPDTLKIHKATKPAFSFGPLSARQGNAL